MAVFRNCTHTHTKTTTTKKNTFSNFFTTDWSTTTNRM